MGIFDIFRKPKKKINRPIDSLSSSTQTSSASYQQKETTTMPGSNNSHIDKTDFQSATSIHSSNDPNTFMLEDLISLNLGGNFSISPYDEVNLFEDADTDASCLIGMIDEEIKEYLPGLSFIKDNDFKKFFHSWILRTTAGLSFAYSIRLGKGLCGMIFVDSAAYNKQFTGLPGWTISFFNIPLFRGHGLMKAALVRMLYILKEKIGLSKVYASVDKTNTKSIHILSSLNFEPTGFKEDSGKGIILCCHLDNLRIVR